MTDRGDADIDRIVHEPGRLAIMAALHGVEEADFVFLLGTTGLTKGNLSSHTAKLESVDYVEIEKGFVDKIPRTIYRLTAEGREALERYRNQMADILDRIG